MLKVYSNRLNDLKEILKQEVKTINLQDLYDLSFYFTDETKYLPIKYKEEYEKSVNNLLITRFKALKNDSKNYSGELSEKDIENVDELLVEDYDDDKIRHIHNIIVIYATYFLKEPIHMPGIIFPGHSGVSYDGKDYYCPVKKYHIYNDNAVCKYCIAKMVED